MPVPETRPKTDPLSTLQTHLQQSEDNGGNLLTVVAGKQDGKDFNFVSFEAASGPQLPTITLVAIKNAPQPLTSKDDLLTEAEEDDAVAKATAAGKTIIFIAPIFDAGTLKTVAVCRDGKVPTSVFAGGTTLQVPQPGVPPGVAEDSTQDFKTDKTTGNFRGNLSKTTGLQGTEKRFKDGTKVIDATETLEAVRGGKNFGAKNVRQLRTKKDGVELIQQADYPWGERKLPDAILVETFGGFPAGTQFVTGKATEFGKHDSIDEGTGSELLKVVQTNSDVFGCSLKQSILSSAFGTPLREKPNLLKALVEIYNPVSKRFARVPIVDVGPREDLEAVIDLTFALDKFLKTDGSAKVQFRIVV